MFGLLDTPFASRATRFIAEPGAAWSGGLPASADDRLSGFAQGTRIATLTGWRAVESLAVGDMVMTFDHGPQPVRALTRGPAGWPRGRCPSGPTRWRCPPVRWATTARCCCCPSRM